MRVTGIVLTVVVSLQSAKPLISNTTHDTPPYLHTATANAVTYTPDWASIDSRPLPSWFDESKIGIFIHWGVFSVPSWGTTGGAAGEWYWWNKDGAKDQAYIDFHNRVYGEYFKYADFANSFKAELFDADQWASLFAKSGAKYVVLTSKHHEGFTNFPAAESWNWNSVDVGPHRDINKELSTAVRAQKLVYGNYYSLFEWFHPLYLQDKANGFNTSRYVDEVMTPQLKNLVNNYAPDVIWSDGDWEAPDTYWKSTSFLSWLYNEAPNKDTVVTNDRWGSGCSLKHGGYYSGGDRYTPGKLQQHKWEDAFTLDSTTWGYKRNSDLSEYLTPVQVIQSIISTVAFGGNVLINIGPTSDGRIVPIFQERLLQMGAFLAVNGEGIYGTKPWDFAQNQTDATLNAFYTTKGDDIYVLVSPWPATNTITLVAPTVSSTTFSVSMIGVSTPLVTDLRCSGGVIITLPDYLSVADSTNEFGFALKLVGFTGKHMTSSSSGCTK